LFYKVIAENDAEMTIKKQDEQTVSNLFFRPFVQDQIKVQKY